MPPAVCEPRRAHVRAHVRPCVRASVRPSIRGLRVWSLNREDQQHEVHSGAPDMPAVLNMVPGVKVAVITIAAITIHVMMVNM